MNSVSRSRRWRLSAVVVVGLLALAPSPSHSAGSQADERHAAELELRLGPGVTVSIHEATGAARFIGTAPGRPIPRPAGVPAGAPPTLTARAFLGRYGGHFGLREPAQELRVEAVGAAPGGGSSIRFGQLHEGVRVLGAELVVNLDRERNVLSVSGETLPSGELESPRLELDPAVAATEAEQAALAAVARAHGAAAAELRATEPGLEIYDSRLLGGPGLDRPALVWRIEVRSSAGEPIRELVLVDARLGSVALQFNQIAHAKNRQICDANNSTAQYPCTAPVRAEGAPPHAVPDVNQAYDFSGDTYDFFFNRFGRDSLDDAGMNLLSTVRWCESLASRDCPYENAFWDGQQMVYGEGFAVDDVVGHELTHGVTEFSSKLFYYYQSGAINESLSDVFGEFVDLTNGSGTDTSAVRWLMGEDLPSSIGVIRNMKNPPAFGDPDRMTSPNYWADPNQVDGGGVHVNSGVNNKAAYLMTDGDTFNGRTVSGLGIDKVARIYYQAQTALLTSASDYADLHDALKQACTNLVGIGGITAADCVEVDDAALATEMNLDPPAAPAPHAPTCATGATAVNSFFDDLENTASGNWAKTSILGTNGWYYPQNTHPYPGFDATYATSGSKNFWGDNHDTRADFAIGMTSNVTVPPGGYLHFQHAYGFEDTDSPSRAWDGGVLEYSTNDGASWTDAGPLFTHNGYTGTIYSGGTANNPLQGRSAFVRESNGYISSRLDLSSLSGQHVRFRFRIGTDSVAGDYGWFIDDVRIYRCDGGTVPPAAPTLTTTVPASPANNNSPGVKGTVGAGSPTQVKIYENATCTGAPDATGSVAQFTGAEGITISVPDNTTTALSARASDAANNDSGCSNTISYVEDSIAPAAPSINATDPNSPSSNSQPLVKGSSSADTATVDVFTQASCAGSPTSGSKSAFEGAGIQVTVSVNQTTQLSARARDAAGNASSCSVSFPYTHDNLAPAAPTLTTTVPASPANNNSPGVKGTVGAGSPTQVKIYKNDATCTGAPDATGSVAQFTGAQGITISVPDNTTTALSARASDAANNDSACSNTISYVEDSLPPQTQIGFPQDATAYTSTAFAAGCADAIPDVCGTSSDSVGLAKVEARIQRDSDSMYWNGLSWQLGEIWLMATGTGSWSFGFDPASGAYTLSARATDTAGNTDLTSAIHSFTVDSEAPAPPTLADSVPESPANFNDPKLTGTAEPGSTVRLYTNSECTGPPAATGSATSFASSGLTVSVADDTTTDVHGTATDAAGNTSTCSAAFPYSEDSTAPTSTILNPKARITDRTPKFKFSASEISVAFKCSLDGRRFKRCASPYVTERLSYGRHVFRVRARDLAKNTGAAARDKFRVVRR